MSKRILENEDLDKLGDRVLRAGKLRPEELEAIVSAPFLFSAVKRKISQGPAPSMNKWGRFSVMRFGILSGAAAAILVSVAGFFIYNTRPPQTTADIPAASVGTRASMHDGTSAPLPDGTPAPLPARFQTAGNNQPSFKHAIYGRARLKNKSMVAKTLRNQHQTRALDTTAEFKPLYAALSDQEDENGQIIRVDLPPSILHAIGVNVQVENEADRIKTDLLVGPDGGLRAFRLVGKY